MAIKLGLLKNRLYRIDKWISTDNKVLYVLLLIVLSVLMLQLYLFFGIFLLSIICIWVVYVKSGILDGNIKFDKSYYILPSIGEVIIVQKDFKYDYAKVRNTKNYIYSKAPQNLLKGFEFYVISIEELDDDWIVKLEFNSNSLDPIILEVFWLDVKDYFMTIADIREEKLKKILNDN